MLECLSESREQLLERSSTIRRIVLETVVAAGEGHIGAALSAADILSVLYFHTLRIDPIEPRHPERDRFILSKGHACLALYAALSLRGFFPLLELKTFGTLSSRLGGHPDRHKVPGVEASTGALGHGVCLAVGMAHAAMMQKMPHRIFALLGDGETQEGSVWEATMAAKFYHLGNLCIIIDHNSQQGMGPLDSVMDHRPLADKFRAFGWNVFEIDGHNIDALIKTFECFNVRSGQPLAVIAQTIKGKGISFMENVPIWHYRCPNEAEATLARRQLGGSWPGWEEAGDA